MRLQPGKSMLRALNRERQFKPNDRRRTPLLITASSYPFLNLFWDILIVFAWILFIWIAITVFIDLFRRHDISGWAKAAWIVLIVILPWIGVLIYIIAYHTGMAERRTKEVQASQAQFDEYVRKTASTGGAASEIENGKAALGQRHNHPGRVRRDQGQGAR